MENNLWKPRFYFPNWIFLFVLLIWFPIFAENQITLRSIDLQSYPEVKVRVHASGINEANDFTISEQLLDTARLTDNLYWNRHPEKNPLNLYLSLPSYTNAEDRRWLLTLANQLVKISEQSGGQTKLHIQSDNSFHVFDRIRSQVLDVSFPYPKEQTPQFPIRNWERLVESIPKINSTEDHILFLVSFSKEWPDRFEIPEFAKRIREKNLKLIVLSPNSLEANKLVSYAKGNFYSIAKQESIESLFHDLQDTTKPDWILTYVSPWRLSLWKENVVLGTLSSVNTGINFEFQYQISPFQTIYRTLSDPLVFFPVSLFLILLCLAALYYLRGYERPQTSQVAIQHIEPVSLVETFERKDELAVYDRMYGETLEKAAKDREIALLTKEKESLPGTSYTYAVLQVREGNQLYEPVPLQWNEMTIGNYESNHIVLHDPSVSGLHAKIKNRKGKYILFDCVSEAGVYLNGRKLLRPKVLHHLDEIQIGKTILTFRGRY
ncbi:FHA domain-containing protein [Leptospira jelokensis]|uniref:FHA domain-containing protein n=1 Tax=Leptospira jelokensis TaxID=2484931 RepID=A0A4Z1A3C1_9LEPT|nr:FHA domain-containing protein [Leptospira jelokensis]TGL74109.1 FHA domain-containing protein [Leptospira jelokensis]